MKRMVPGLVICSALVAVGAGVVVFTGPDRETNIWDGVFIVSTLAFLVFFVMLLVGKAAATIADDVGGVAPDTTPRAASARMSEDSRRTQPATIPGPETRSSTNPQRRDEPSEPRKDRSHETKEPHADRFHRESPR